MIVTIFPKYFFASIVSLYQKESLGEYGSGWGWERVKYTHVLDHTYSDGTPVRYDNPTTKAIPQVVDGKIDYGISTSNKGAEICILNYTSGQSLYSGAQMLNGVSCIPHVYNVGNYYSEPATKLDGNFNSTCPKGWQLPESNTKTDFLYQADIYGIAIGFLFQHADTPILNLPFSYLRTSMYDTDGVIRYSGDRGYYRTSTYQFHYASNIIADAYNGILYGEQGTPIRCVAR